MKRLTLVLAFISCGEKRETPPKQVDKQEPARPATPADVPVTTKTEKALELFENGRDLTLDARGREAAEQFEKAIELDPNFAQAHAYLGSVTPGTDGVAALAKATALMASLPEAEQQQIIAMQAMRVGDRTKAKVAYAKVLELAPGAWRAAFALGTIATAEQDHEGAIKYFESVVRAKPDNANAYNGLAYARAGRGDWDKAIAAARKQVELKPKDANPNDTLGEVLLQASKFDDAEKAFSAALAADPTFAIAWQGVGLARAYAGNFKGAHEAFDKRLSGPELFDKLQTRLDDAWVWFAEDNLPQAMAAIDALESEPGAKDSPLYAFAAVDRAHILSYAGKHADAAKAYAVTLQRSAAVTGGGKDELMRGYRSGVLRLAAMMGKPALDTEKLLADAAQDMKRIASPAYAASHLGYLAGLVAWAKNDLRGAIAELSKCQPRSSLCRFDLAALQRKTGDKAGAQATEKLLRETPTRDPATVYTIAHLPKP